MAHRWQRLGLGVRYAHRRPWTPEEDALLGTASDTEIAARLDRHIATVCIRRQKLGIPNLYWQHLCGLASCPNTVAGRIQEIAARRRSHWESRGDFLSGVGMVWFKVLSPRAGREEYAERITTMLSCHYHYGREKMFMIARRTATPHQRKALDAALIGCSMFKGEV